MTAITNEPKASEPRWYLNTQYNPMKIEPLPLLSDVLVKYHIAQAADIINYPTPIIKAFIHKKPNKEYKREYLVSSLHLTIDKNGNSGLGPNSPIDPM